MLPCRCWRAQEEVACHGEGLTRGGHRRLPCCVPFRGPLTSPRPSLRWSFMSSRGGHRPLSAAMLAQGSRAGCAPRRASRAFPRMLLPLHERIGLVHLVNGGPMLRGDLPMRSPLVLPLASYAGQDGPGNDPGGRECATAAAHSLALRCCAAASCPCADRERVRAPVGSGTNIPPAGPPAVKGWQLPTAEGGLRRARASRPAGSRKGARLVPVLC
jgi:hypothetical protein